MSEQELSSGRLYEVTGEDSPVLAIAPPGQTERVRHISWVQIMATLINP